MSINGFVLYFICLSFIGYIYETVAMSIWGGKFENRGFLYGPIIPIYGVGAVIGTLLFTYLWDNVSNLQLFLIGMVCSAILEYPTHYLMEKIFNQRWWDYSNAPLNLNGRICLPAAMGFGIGALIIVKVINPFVIPLINRIPETTANVLSLFAVGIFAADIATTVAIISDFEDRIANFGEKLDDSLENLLSHVLNEEKPFKDKAYKIMNAPKNAKEKIKEVPTIAKEKAQVVSSATVKLRNYRKENYKKVIRRYKKYKEYRKNAYAPKVNDER